jgi:hypothetical protein
MAYVVSTIQEIPLSHPLVNAITRNIATLTSLPGEDASYAKTSQQIADIVAVYAKQLAAQRDLLRVRLQTIYVVQKSDKLNLSRCLQFMHATA